MERAIEIQKDLYLCFTDFSKAFGKIIHSDLFDILLRHNCDGKILESSETCTRNKTLQQESVMTAVYSN